MYTKLILLNPISNPIKNPTGAMVLNHESVGIIGLPRVTNRLSCSLNSAGHCSPAFASTHCTKNWHDVYRRGAGNPFLLKIALLYSANEALNKNHKVAKHVHFMYSHFVSRSIIFCTYAVDTCFSPFSSALFTQSPEDCNSATFQVCKTAAARSPLSKQWRSYLQQKPGALDVAALDQRMPATDGSWVSDTGKSFWLSVSIASTTSNS